MAFQSFDHDRTWWWLFQKYGVRIKFDIYVFITTLNLLYIFWPLEI